MQVPRPLYYRYRYIRAGVLWEEEAAHVHDQSPGPGPTYGLCQRSGPTVHTAVQARM